MSSHLSSRCRDLAFTLTSWPSVTGTQGEIDFAPKLASLLDGLHLGPVWLEPVSEGLPGRCNVLALKSGAGRRTIVLAGHFDTVPFEDYGELAELALQPRALAEALITRLKLSGENPLALADLSSGDFLPGRGLLDMKTGVAAGIAAMEAYAGELSLLLVATPDEEDRSAGMRAAVPAIRRAAQEIGLELELMINLDAISDQGNGSLGRSVAFGSIGKQLLTALAIGKEAHACFPQDGINAAYLAAELISEFEMAPALAERTGDELAAPPTALGAKDLKLGYNVTTPGKSWVIWNTLQHRRTASELMDIAAGLASTAMARVEQRFGVPVPILRFSEVARRLGPGALEARASALAGAHELDLPERAKRITAELAEQAGLSRPCVILGLGSIPYPAVSMQDRALERIILQAAAPFDLRRLSYFPGISDMSFVGERGAETDPGSTENPLWGSSFAMPDGLGLPAINIGPWGRDYHHWLERMHVRYAFETLPQVLLKVIEAVGRGSRLER